MAARRRAGTHSRPTPDRGHVLDPFPDPGPHRRVPPTPAPGSADCSGGDVRVPFDDASATSEHASHPCSHSAPAASGPCSHCYRSNPPIFSRTTLPNRQFRQAVTSFEVPSRTGPEGIIGLTVPPQTVAQIDCGFPHLGVCCANDFGPGGLLGEDVLRYYLTESVVKEMFIAMNKPRQEQKKINFCYGLLGLPCFFMPIFTMRLWCGACPQCGCFACCDADLSLPIQNATYCFTKDSMIRVTVEKIPDRGGFNDGWTTALEADRMSHHAGKTFISVSMV